MTHILQKFQGHCFVHFLRCRGAELSGRDRRLLLVAGVDNTTAIVRTAEWGRCH